MSYILKYNSLLTETIFQFFTESLNIFGVSDNYKVGVQF